MTSIVPYLFVSGVIFLIGALGFFLRRSVLIIFMSIEMMLSAVNLTFAAFSRMLGQMDGQVFVFLAMTISACEVALGLSMIMLMFRHVEKLDVDEFNLLRD